MNNSIYIRRKNKVHIERGNHILPEDYIHNFLMNIEGLGFTFSNELIDALRTLSVERLSTFYKQTILDLRELVGAHVVYNPMYPNFPEQVKKASETELYSNAFLHYFGDWIGKRILPNYNKEKRLPLQDAIQLKTIELGNKDDFNSIFSRLLGAKTSISAQDAEDITWFVKAYGANILKFVPAEIPLKENIALLIGTLLEHNIDAQILITSHIKTATDALRLATVLSKGDVSLAGNTRFISFSKKHRKLILQTLEKLSNIAEDMLKYQNKWKRLGERLHPFEYKEKFPKCFEAFDVIRNKKKLITFNSQVESYLIQRDISTLTTLLSSRPGEFARRLDNLIRLSDAPESVVLGFANIAHQVSTPVLLQLKAHFLARNNKKMLRVFFPKGNVSIAKAISNKLPNINPTTCNEIVG